MITLLFSLKQVFLLYLGWRLALTSAQPLAWVGWVEWVELYGKMIDSIITGKKGPIEALKTAYQEGNIILKKKGTYLRGF